MPRLLKLGRMRGAAPFATGAAAGIRWSDPATWGGALPTSATDVIIPPGVTILLDMTGAVARSITVQRLGASRGRLMPDPAVASVSLTCEWMLFDGGTFQAGFPGAPYTGKAVFTFNGTRVEVGPRWIVDDSTPNPDNTNLQQTGVGDGVLAGLWPSTGVQAGNYVLTFGNTATSPQTFTVSGPGGFSASGTEGVLFDNQIRFTFRQGSTRMGTGATRTVTAAQRGKVNTGQGRSAQFTNGAKILIYEPVPARVRTTLADNVAANATTLPVSEDLGLAAGDTIVVTPSDFRGETQGRYDTLTVQSATSNAITTAAGLPGGRWGKLQYVNVTATGTKMLSYSAAFAPGAPAGVSQVYDVRAAVVKTNRRVVFQGADDAAWASGFGFHLMVDDPTCEIDITGLEIRNAGQLGDVGRYPFHLHCLSWNMPGGPEMPSDGTFRGNFGGAWRYGSVVNSVQRACVLHGTCGFTVQDLVAVNVQSHAFFLEDGSELDNQIIRPTIVWVSEPPADKRLQDHDVKGQAISAGASGIWLSNPRNTVVDPWIYGAANVGMWNAFATPYCTGFHRACDLYPIYTDVQQHTGLRAIGNGHLGMMTEHSPANSFGMTLSAPVYLPQSNGRPAGGVDINFSITGFTLAKNGSSDRGGGYQNRVGFPQYRDAIVGDNVGLDFFGQTRPPTPTMNASIQRVLAIDTSLNDAVTPDARAPLMGRYFAATYHETWFMRYITALGYAPAMPNANTTYVGRGLINLGDTYIQGVFRFEQFTDFYRPQGNATGWAKSPNIDGYPLVLNGVNRYWSTALAINDVNGIFVTAGRTWVQETPFSSTGIANAVAVSPATVNGYETTTPFYGVSITWVNFQARMNMEINYERVDPNTLASIANFNIQASSPSNFFDIMRSASLMKGGAYKVTFPGKTATTAVIGELRDAWRSTDSVLLGIQFDATASAVYVGHIDAFPGVPSATLFSAGKTRLLTAAANLAQVQSDTTGTKFFQVGNVVWFKFAGGLVPHAETGLNAYYKRMMFEVYA